MPTCEMPFCLYSAFQSVTDNPVVYYGLLGASTFLSSFVCSHAIYSGHLFFFKLSVPYFSQLGPCSVTYFLFLGLIIAELFQALGIRLLKVLHTLFPIPCGGSVLHSGNLWESLRREFYFIFKRAGRL